MTWEERLKNITRVCKKMSEEENLATAYKKKIENASQAQLDYAKKYREEHPNAKRSDAKLLKSVENPIIMWYND